MITFTPSLSERKRILKLVCNKHSQWKIRMTFSVILFILAAGIMIGFAALLIWQHAIPVAVYAFMATALCFACVPFFSGLSVKNTAKYICGLPYSSFANGTLFLKDDVLEYVFWHVGPDEPAAYSSKRAVYRARSKFVYSIPKAEIKDVSIQDGVCTIMGKGRIQMPKGAVEDDAVKECCDSFGFLLAFEQSDAMQKIKQWRG